MTQMLFNQFLWRKARELEEYESSNLKGIDQVYQYNHVVSIDAVYSALGIKK